GAGNHAKPDYRCEERPIAPHRLPSERGGKTELELATAAVLTSVVVLWSRPRAAVGTQQLRIVGASQQIRCFQIELVLASPGFETVRHSEVERFVRFSVTAQVPDIEGTLPACLSGVRERGVNI